MSEDAPRFLIDAEEDPILLRIEGRAAYTNCAPFSKLFAKLIAKGRREYVVDFEQCTGMDSTFLGILAGVALEVRRMNPPGVFTICKLNRRNRDLVQNLGLHRIMNVCDDEERVIDDSGIEEIKGKGIVPKEIILEAHENLIKADKKNKHEFQDVIEYLKKQVEEK
jgi:anti-sigma B factor antagonist